jgi:hypothetical protein
VLLQALQSIAFLVCEFDSKAVLLKLRSWHWDRRLFSIWFSPGRSWRMWAERLSWAAGGKLLVMVAITWRFKWFLLAKPTKHKWSAKVLTSPYLHHQISISIHFLTGTVKLLEIWDCSAESITWVGTSEQLLFKKSRASVVVRPISSCFSKLVWTLFWQGVSVIRSMHGVCIIFQCQNCLVRKPKFPQFLAMYSKNLPSEHQDFVSAKINEQCWSLQKNVWLV